MTTHTRLARDAFADFLSHVGQDTDLAEDEDEFQAHFRGEWESEKAYAMEKVCSELGWNGVDPEHCDQLAPYLDWDLIATEMFRHGNWTFIDGFVFEDET